MMGPGMREFFKDDLEKAEKRGIEQGLEQGLGRGEEKQRRTSVIRMLNLGRTPEAISDFTGEDLVYVQAVQMELLEAAAK